MTSYNMKVLCQGDVKVNAIITSEGKRKPLYADILKDLCTQKATESSATFPGISKKLTINIYQNWKKLETKLTENTTPNFHQIAVNSK